ncbi:hypothetical protein F4779DRAFT_231246 [Xylariaceae sp. FL0662B]|nr:hypothetical protein F4779DRAFT_231246 [Xylariaceae sp. FL0662B]
MRRRNMVPAEDVELSDKLDRVVRAVFPAAATTAPAAGPATTAAAAAAIAGPATAAAAVPVPAATVAPADDATQGENESDANEMTHGDSEVEDDYDWMQESADDYDWEQEADDDESERDRESEADYALQDSIEPEANSSAENHFMPGPNDFVVGVAQFTEEAEQNNPVSNGLRRGETFIEQRLLDDTSPQWRAAKAKYRAMTAAECQAELQNMQLEYLAAWETVHEYPWPR